MRWFHISLIKENASFQSFICNVLSSMDSFKILFYSFNVHHTFSMFNIITLQIHYIRSLLYFTLLYFTLLYFTLFCFALLYFYSTKSYKTFSQIVNRICFRINFGWVLAWLNSIHLNWYLVWFEDFCKIKPDGPILSSYIYKDESLD